MSPRSSAALTDEHRRGVGRDGGAGGRARPRRASAARSSNGPPGRGLDLHVLAAGRDRVERVGEHGVGAAVADHGVGRAVARVDRVVLRGALEDVRALAAGDVALAGLHRQAVAAAVAGDRDGLGVDVGRALDVLDVGADQVVLAGGAVVGQAVERVRRRDAPAVGRGVDPVAADQRVGAGVRAAASSLPSPPRERVVAGEAVDRVVARAAVDAVVAGAAGERVVAVAAAERSPGSC